MFKLLKRNKNYKLIIGLIIGFLFSSSVVVYAWYNDFANEEYDFNKEGTYELYYVAKDGSGNEKREKFHENFHKRILSSI